MIPYDGALRRSGALVDGSRAMRFTLYDADGVEIWREERSDEASTDCASPCQVTFYRGDFSVLLGEHAALPEAALSAPALYIGLEIRDEGGAWLALRGRQVITPTPFALWSARGEEMEVAGALNTPSLSVSGRLELDGAAPSIMAGLTVAGALTAASARLTRDLSVGGALTISGDLDVTDGAVYVGQHDVRFGVSDAYGDGGRALVHLDGDRLRVNYAGDFAGGVEVDGTLRAGGNSTISGTARVTGDYVSWGGVAGHEITPSQPLVTMRYINMGTSVSVNTGFSTSDYLCSVGGWILGRGDINEGGEVHIARMYTYANNGTWWVSADFASHNEGESHEVMLVCFQTSMSTTDSGWGAP